MPSIYQEPVAWSWFNLIFILNDWFSITAFQTDLVYFTPRCWWIAYIGHLHFPFFFCCFFRSFFCVECYRIRIIFKQIYLIQRWDPPTPGQSGPPSTGYDGVLHTPHISRNELSQSNAVWCYTENIYFRDLILR